MPASPPRQARSRETLDRVLDAATEVITEKGQLDFNLPEVARRAGVSVGTVYRRFATKDELVLTVLHRLREEERESAISLWATTDWTSMSIREMTDRVVADISRIWREQAPLMQAVMLRHLMMDADSAFDGGVERMVGTMDEFRAVIRACGRPIPHPDADLACDFAYRMIVGLCARRTARAIETQTPREISWDDLIDQVSDAVARYLFGPEYATN